MLDLVWALHFAPRVRLELREIRAVVVTNVNVLRESEAEEKQKQT